MTTEPQIRAIPGELLVPTQRMNIRRLTSTLWTQSCSDIRPQTTAIGIANSRRSESRN